MGVSGFRREDGDDRPSPGEGPRGNQGVGAGRLHTQLPAAGGLSGQAARAHQRQGELGLQKDAVSFVIVSLQVKLCGAEFDQGLLPRDQ